MLDILDGSGGPAGTQTLHEPVVLIHCSASSARQWQGLAETSGVSAGRCDRPFKSLLRRPTIFFGLPAGINRSMDAATAPGCQTVRQIGEAGALRPPTTWSREMLTHLVIFRSAMVRQTYDLPDAFRARPRDFVLISEPGRPGPGPDEAADYRAVAELGGAHDFVC
jgi:hypothetical protein